MRDKLSLALLHMGVILIFLAAGCNAAVTSPTPVPPSPTPLPATPTAVPTAFPTAIPLPTDSAPNNRVPAIKNYSLVAGSVTKIEPDASNSAVLRLTLNVTSSSHVEGFASFTDDKVGQEMVILVDSSLVGAAAAGDPVQVKVTYRGDERGGSFYASELTILPK